MRDLYKIMDKLAGTTNIVSFHYKTFPLKPFYLTIHDKESECHMYGEQSMDELEAAVKKDWSHLLEFSINGMTIKCDPTLADNEMRFERPQSLPLPAGFPKPL